MKKLLLIYILIVSIIFISGCTSEEKKDSETSYLQSSGSLINPNNLIDGYNSIRYETHAKRIEESYSVDILGYYSSSQTLYEGEVPTGKRRIRTSFTLLNKDGTSQFIVSILELDSVPPFEELISIYKSQKFNSQNIPSDLHERRNLVGDNSIQYTYQSEPTISDIFFTINNYIVIIEGQGIQEKNMEAETLKVAKTIEGEID